MTMNGGNNKTEQNKTKQNKTMKSSISSLVRILYVKYATQVPDVVLYEFYK